MVRINALLSIVVSRTCPLPLVAVVAAVGGGARHWWVRRIIAIVYLRVQRMAICAGDNGTFLASC